MVGATWTLLLLALVALRAEAQEETFHRKLASRLLRHCLQDDVWACVAFKGQHLLQGPSSSEDLAQRQVDKQLLGTFNRLLDDSLGAGLASSQARGKLKFLGPLLGGMILKFVALIPVVLGALAFLGIQSVIASKLSLGIAALMALKKLYQGGDVHHGLEAYQQQFPLQQQYQAPVPQYLDPYHAGAALPETHEHQRRRVIVVRKGREFLPPDTDSQPWMDNNI